ncbi:MAG TPA: PLP-dependent aspartate aminotransferase family protein [Candidatus Hydrogenedentes bacterium]|jgi:cystathionine gamma-synthase|nr:MAG: Cystathionine gamma-lyase [Candidatus Hydrogenedentes bacterium ADurb.Bin170]HNZ49347.1 PLP-dependent aspartate aminotransferase family protein [Candidatus Hydrogenedentota bacterium]HOD96554.1 PLP-dependent aspartate aminotransferase family protein [Candidatus Hydrogenedentota bacterium]HOH42164.1 PLP-dependent aspartate aminotransferase family protein [Candidatus Hydrogenedentota bacterium]HOM48036.1 PLP-dependent aspartate aminotransferase family protein [Candidatus Hydrogenedentota 
MKDIPSSDPDKSNLSRRDISTLSVHAGEERFRYADSITTPIVQTSTYAFKNTGHIEAYTRHGEAHFEYGRYGNPTEKVAQDRLAAICGAEDCVVFGSGMSAITTTILALVKSRDHIIITDDAYKKTLEFCSAYLQRFGVDCTIVPFGDYAALEKAIRPQTRFIFSESPTNPYLNIFDLERLRDLARRYNLLTLIDSTFSTPYNQCPFEYGVDIVLHSATKYLAGHNDILAGAVLGRKELIEEIRALHKAIGGVIDPHCSYLLLRGLKTFALRMERQNQSGMEVARFLENHPRVKRVYYPGLESHPQHETAKAQMTGFGSVISFDINGDLDDAKRFLDKLKLCYIAPSLGGVETLITHPALVSYYSITREERYALGITDSLLRLAVGIENPADIIADLNQALQ